MKLECALTAVNEDPFYRGFVPVFIEAWQRTHPQVDVRIVLVADEVPDDLKQYGDRIVPFKPLEGVPTSFTAQCIRLLYPGLLGYEGGVMIADVDNIPLSSTYYLERAENVTDDSFLSLNALPYLKLKQIYMPHSLAASKTWREMFGVGTVGEARQRLKDMYANRYKTSKEIVKLLRANKKKKRRLRSRLKIGWNNFMWSIRKRAKMILKDLPRARSIADVKAACFPVDKDGQWYMDQRELYERAMRWNKAGGKLVLLRRGLTDSERLNGQLPYEFLGRKERERFAKFEDPNFEFEEVKARIAAGYYFNMNCPRPYSKYKELIDAIVELL